MSLLKKLVEKKKSEKHAWPEGWMTREQAANDLGVAPRDVDDALKEVIRDGDVQKQFFGVWDSRQGRVVRLPGYRVAEKGEKEQKVAKTASKPAAAKGKPADLTHGRIERALGRDSGQTDYQIAKNCGCTVGRVRDVRASLGL